MGGLSEEVVVEIKNADGLHMRPAMQFVECAGHFESEVLIEANGNTVNGKSIMQLTMLAAGKGTKLKIITEGPDYQEALSALVNIVEGRTPNEFIK